MVQDTAIVTMEDHALTGLG